MKVYLSKPRYHWISPYKILEFVCFWEKDTDVFYNIEEKPGNKYDKWVNFLEPICRGIQKFLDFVHPQINHVKIDYWDTWSMDHTLTPIILPMLKQLKETKHGYGMIDDEDVPKHLRSIYALPKNSWDWDGNAQARYEWVLNEMIFAFSCRADDSWEEQFRSGNIDHKTEACAWYEDGKPSMYRMVEGPNHTYKCDYEGMRVVEERIQNGFRLFGKYYQTLWD